MSSLETIRQANFGVSPYSIFVRSVDYQIDSWNGSNMPMMIKAYYCKPRRCIPKYVNGVAVGTTDGWVAALLANDNTSDPTHVGFTLFQSPTFVKNVKILRVQSRRIPIHGVFKFRHTFRRPFKYRYEEMMQTSFFSVPQTRFVTFVIHGCVGNIETPVFLPDYGPARCLQVFRARSRMNVLQAAQGTTVYQENMATGVLVDQATSGTSAVVQIKTF